MKKLITAGLMAASVITAGSAQAQKSGGARPAFAVGDNTIGLGVGVGLPYTYGGFGSIRNSPAFLVTYDHGTFGNVGPGTIGIGGIMSIQNSAYRYGNGRRETWTSFALGVRGTYHLTLLKDKNNKFDPYGGVTFGFRAESSTYYSGTDVRPMAGAFVGAKYNFVKNFGVWSELGFDVAIFKVGINFNF